MGPKRADTVAKGNKVSQSNIVVLSTTGGGTTTEQEHQQCIGKFAADLELCCREPPPAYPVPIPVYIRGHSMPPPPISQVQSFPPSSQQQIQQPGGHSGTSVTPSVAGAIAEEQLSSTGKKTSRSRVPSAGQSGIIIGITGIENESRSFSVSGQEPSKISSSPYKTFQLLDDSEFFRPKLLTDSVGNETESIDQITALYMRAWQLDQRFIDILKKVLPLQEQLHTLNFCFVGLNEQTISGLVELCQGVKNLKNVSLDGNPSASAYFYRLIENDDSKIIHLSLRFCDIADAGAEQLANALGNMSRQNWKLVTLNLSGNRIGDQGAASFATALRYNRSLVLLNLSSNLITDKSAILLARVLRRIVLTPEEIVRRRYLIAQRYAETHPDDWRYNTNSPTPSNISAKSKSGRDSRVDWKRFTDPNKRKLNPTKIAQIVVDKRNRPESEENRPISGRQSDLKRGRNEGSAGARSTTVNPSSTTGNTSRRAINNPSNANSKDSDQPRISGPARAKKMAAALNAASKKNISRVKEEKEDALGEENPMDMSMSDKLTSSKNRQIERENPLLETNDTETHDGEIWLKGNYVLLSLNLSRNYLTLDSVKEFLLSIQQQQSTFTHLTDAVNLSSATTTITSLMDFSGLCRLELKGMNDISMKSSEYQSLETILSPKNPSIRFQQLKERETKDLLDTPPIQSSSQQLPPTVADKTTHVSEKIRTGSIFKSLTQRPTSRPKD